MREKWSSNRKTQWCIDCTDWQLSVEPGFAPYVPPSSFDEDDEDDAADDDDDNEIIPVDEVPGERIEDVRLLHHKLDIPYNTRSKCSRNN